MIKLGKITYLLATTFLLALPILVLADPITGEEPFSNAFIEAELGENGTTYSLKNLTNKQWQNNLIVDWVANIPCGTFDQSTNGLVAIWNRNIGCERLNLKTNPVSVAVFIENLEISGKERMYTDGYVVQFPEGPENVIVYAEYPEEGRKHGFGTSLLYADESAIEKYYGAKRASLGLDAFGLKPEEDGSSASSQSPEIIPVSTEPETPDNSIPWVPITLGVVVVATAGAFVFKKRFSNRWSFMANASLNKWSDRDEASMDFSRDSVPDQYASEDELARRDRDDAIEASDRVDRKNRDKFFEHGRQEPGGAAQNKAKPRLSDTAPAQYQKPEGEPEDPETM